MDWKAVADFNAWDWKAINDVAGKVDTWTSLVAKAWAVAFAAIFTALKWGRQLAGLPAETAINLAVISVEYTFWATYLLLVGFLVVGTLANPTGQPASAPTWLLVAFAIATALGLLVGWLRIRGIIPKAKK